MTYPVIKEYESGHLYFASLIGAICHGGKLDDSVDYALVPMEDGRCIDLMDSLVFRAPYSVLSLQKTFQRSQLFSSFNTRRFNGVQSLPLQSRRVKDPWGCHSRRFTSQSKGMDDLSGIFGIARTSEAEILC